MKDKTEEQSIYSANQNPVVKLSMNNNDESKQEIRSNKLEPEIHEVAKINSKKKVISKYVEVTTKIVYTYEDGSKKEVIEKEDHTFTN